MNLDQRFRQYKLNTYLPEEEDTIVTPTIEVTPQPSELMQSAAPTEVLKGIEQTNAEKLFEAAGLTLEDIGNALDSIGKINIKGVEIGLRDLLPFVGAVENGKVTGTPAALQAVGRGESLIRGKGMAAELTPDAKLMAADLLTAGIAVPASKGIVKGVTKMTKALK
jgi:hypothetical protein